MDDDGYRVGAVARLAGVSVDIRAAAAAINQEFLAAMTAGAPADDPRATDAAERHRQHISRWFYDCPLELHRGLAEMYLADERFRKNYDDLAPGLARYVHDAILANAGRGPSRRDHDPGPG